MGEVILIRNYSKPVLIYNPVAGKLKRDNQRILHRTIEALAGVGVKVEAIPTTGPATATGLARAAVKRGADLVIALGGDGTINEIANGVIGTDTPLAILPGGTANCLGIETGMGTNPVRAVARLEKCVPRRIAVGRLTCRELSGGGETSRNFLSMVGVGLDAKIVSEVNPAIKKATGKLAYWVAGMRQFFSSLAQFRGKHSGGEGEYGFALASRLRNYGGDLSIATGASLMSGHFETLQFRGSNPLRYALYMTAVVLRLHKRMPGVVTHRVREAVFEPTGDKVVYVQADGELAGVLPARVEIVDDALTLLVPAGVEEREGRYLVGQAVANG